MRQWIIVVLALAGCNGDDERQTGTPIGNGLLLSTDASDDAIAQQVEDVADALAAAENTSGAAAFLSANRPLARTRICDDEAIADSAVVTITWSGELTVQAPLKTMTTSVTGTEKRTWSGPAAVKCNSTNKYAAITWNNPAEVEGLTLAVEESRLRQMKVTRTTRRGAVTFEREARINGNRTLEWESVDDSGTDLVLTKKITESTVTREFPTSINGVTKTIASKVEVRTGHPVTIVVTRDKATPALVKTRTVNGTTYTTDTGDDSSFIETTYTNVVWTNPTDATKSCAPISGEISGKIWSAEPEDPDTEPETTFKITITDSGATIAYDGETAGTAFTFNPTCSLHKGIVDG